MQPMVLGDKILTLNNYFKVSKMKNDGSDYRACNNVGKGFWFV